MTNASNHRGYSGKKNQKKTRGLLILGEHVVLISRSAPSGAPSLRRAKGDDSVTTAAQQKPEPGLSAASLDFLMLIALFVWPPRIVMTDAHPNKRSLQLCNNTPQHATFDVWTCLL